TGGAKIGDHQTRNVRQGGCFVRWRHEFIPFFGIPGPPRTALNFCHQLASFNAASCSSTVLIGSAGRLATLTCSEVRCVGLGRVGAIAAACSSADLTGL